MRSSSSLLGRVLLWIASEMLEILTEIFLRVLRVLRGFFSCLRRVVRVTFSVCYWRREPHTSPLPWVPT